MICPICDGPVFQIAKLKGHRTGIKTPVWACLNCSFVFQRPNYCADEQVQRKDLGWQLQRDISHSAISRRRLEEMLRIKPDAKTFLEIGCGIGTVLKEGQKLGLDCMGIEPNPYICDYNMKYDRLNIKEAFFDASSVDRQFDLVMLDNVLEHIPTPRPFMRDVFSSVAPNGLLYFIVRAIVAAPFGYCYSIFFPKHGKSIFRANDVHINHFFQKSIMKLAEENKAIRVATERRAGAYIFRKAASAEVRPLATPRVISYESIPSPHIRRPAT